MFNDDISESPPSYTPCSAVRITPYDGDHPDHDQAVTYRFEKPITFVHVYRTRHPYLGTTLGRDERPMPALVGFTIPNDFDETDTAGAVAQGLWQRRGTFVAVDLWSRGVSGYLYALLPFWKRGDLGDHPDFAERPGHHTITVGESQTAPRPIRWPRSTPSLGAYDIETGVQMLLSTDIDPPPPAGFPATGQRTTS